MHWTVNTTNFVVLAAAYILSDAGPWLAFRIKLGRIERMTDPVAMYELRQRTVHELADDARACRRLRYVCGVSMVLAAIGSAVYQ